MHSIIVDPNMADRRKLEKMLSDSTCITDVKSFGCAKSVLKFAEEFSKEHEKVHLAFIETEIGKSSGIELAAKLREIFPRMFIVFVTNDSTLTMDAFKVNANGYVLKPITEESIQKELTNVATFAPAIIRKRVFVHTFGNFDIFVDNRPLHFSSAKAKELLAYLVDRKGAAITCEQAIAVLWEDRPYDSCTRSLCRMIMSSLRHTLEDADISNIIEDRRNSKSINADNLICDYYAFINGNEFFIHQYIGEYMEQYSWASTTAATLDIAKNLYI